MISTNPVSLSTGQVTILCHDNCLTFYLFTFSQCNHENLCIDNHEELYGWGSVLSENYTDHE